MSFVEKALEKAKATLDADRIQGSAGLGHARLAPPATPPIVPLPSLKPKHSIAIDRAQLESAGLVPPEGDRLTIAHQYRVIKRELLRQSVADDAEDRAHGRAVMIASALPGDGKTFTCLNLAFSMAVERDHAVLLIDGDIAKPHISRALGCSERPGLLDLLRDPTQSLDSVVLATDVPGLLVLPAGEWSDDASELVASDRMQVVFAELMQREPRRVMLLDSPPVLATSDARVMASVAGQVVVVIRAGVTPQSAVREAVDALRDSDRQICVVLNQVASSASLDYLYGYGSGYGYGGKPDRAPRVAGEDP